MNTYSAAELLDKDENTFENAINKYRFIKSEEFLERFNTMFEEFQKFLETFEIEVENIDIDFLCGNRGAEPIVNVSDNYTDKIQWVKETIEGFIDLLFREYESCTLTEEFISYATFEGLEFDEMGYWVDKDDDDYFIY